jgi:hypothetical protein
MARRGRPSIYTEALAQTICDRIAGGEFLRSICREPKMPEIHTITRWVSRDHCGFADRYWNARCAQAVLWSEDVLEVLDDVADEDSMPKVQAARNRSDARKWLLSKLVAARFGDRIQLDQVGARAEVHIHLPGKFDPANAKVLEGTAKVLEHGDAPEAGA